MTNPDTDLQRLRSMVDHPAGRAGAPHRPHHRADHRADHHVGHARTDRDVAPGSDLFESIGLLLALVTCLAVIGLCTVIGWHLVGIIGAAAGCALAIAGISAVSRRL